MVTMHFKMEENKMTNAEKMKIMEKIDEEMLKFIKAGKYKDMLAMMGKFNSYSFNNQMWLLSQMPSLTTVHSLTEWNKLGRHIKKGSKSLKIFIPNMKKVELKDEDDNVIRHKYVPVSFSVRSVFDISQTEGKDLENPLKLDDTVVVSNKNDIVHALMVLANQNGYQLKFVDNINNEDGTLGCCNHNTKVIEIRNDLCDLQTVSTIIHECGHMLAHGKPRADFKGLTSNERREIKEVEAESIACIVCDSLGLDTKDFNFGYILNWSDGDIKLFRKNLSIVYDYAKVIKDAIAQAV